MLRDGSRRPAGPSLLALTRVGVGGATQTMRAEKEASRKAKERAKRDALQSEVEQQLAGLQDAWFDEENEGGAAGNKAAAPARRGKRAADSAMDADRQIGDPQRLSPRETGGARPAKKARGVAPAAASGLRPPAAAVGDTAGGAGARAEAGARRRSSGDGRSRAGERAGKKRALRGGGLALGALRGGGVGGAAHQSEGAGAGAAAGAAEAAALCGEADALFDGAGEFDAAEALYRRALAADPAHVPALCNLALLLETTLDAGAEAGPNCSEAGPPARSAEEDASEADRLYARAAALSPADVRAPPPAAPRAS